MPSLLPPTIPLPQGSQRDPLGRRIWWCHISFPSNLYSKSVGSHWRYINLAYGNLHGLSFIYLSVLTPDTMFLLSFLTQDTPVIVLPAKNTMLQFFHKQVFLSRSQFSPPSSLLLGRGNSYSLFTAQFNGHFLREVFSHFSNLIRSPYKEFL